MAGCTGSGRLPEYGFALDDHGHLGPAAWNASPSTLTMQDRFGTGAGIEDLSA